MRSEVITPANEQERAHEGELCRQIQEMTGQTVAVGFVDQGHTGEETAYAAAVHDIVKKPEGETGSVLLRERESIKKCGAVVPDGQLH